MYIWSDNIRKKTRTVKVERLLKGGTNVGIFAQITITKLTCFFYFGTVLISTTIHFIRLSLSHTWDPSRL